jgi:hypothetical protein
MGKGRRTARALCLVLDKALGLRRDEAVALRKLKSWTTARRSADLLEKGVFLWNVYHMFVLENGVKAVRIEIP